MCILYTCDYLFMFMVLFLGGRAGNEREDDGEGGYSWVDGPFGKVLAGAHPGPGRVFIIPAISGCNCDYLCVTLDYHRQDIQCLCPLGWNLDSDKHSCVCKYHFLSVYFLTYYVAGFF